MSECISTVTFSANRALQSKAGCYLSDNYFVAGGTPDDRTIYILSDQFALIAADICIRTITCKLFAITGSSASSEANNLGFMGHVSRTIVQ